MKRVWKEVPRGDRRAQWAGMYVTMNRKGMIVLNRAAHERAGGFEAFLLLYDPANNTIGLKPSTPMTRNAYRLLAEWGVVVQETLEFPDAEIDLDGILVLNLRTAKVSNRALNHPRRKTPAG